MTEQLPAGRATHANVWAMNTPAELFATHTEGALIVTLDPPALYVRNEGQWVPLASVAGNIPPPTVVGASEGAAGVAELATQEETNNGSDTFRIVTPARLSGRTATEERSGVVEEATPAEVQAGTAGVLYVSASKMKAELDRRIVPQHGFFLAGDGPTVFGGVTAPAGGAQVSTDLRGVGGVPVDAKGVSLMVRVLAEPANKELFIDSADAPNAAPNSPRHRVETTVTSGQYVVGLGSPAGANAGKIRISAEAGVGTSGISAWVTGWYR